MLGHRTRPAAQAPAVRYRLALTKRGEAGAKVGGLREVTRSWVNRLAVAPNRPGLMTYLNAR